MRAHHEACPIWSGGPCRCAGIAADFGEPYDNPYWIEDANGKEVAEAESVEAIKDAARYLIQSGECEAPLTVHSRVSGLSSQAFIDPDDPGQNVTFTGFQGNGGFR